MKGNSKDRILASLFVVLLAFQLFYLLPLPTAFCDDKTEINFPKALQIIGEEAFSTTSIKTLVFGDELQYIGKRAFQNNTNLSGVYIPKSVVYIGESAFPEYTGMIINGVEGSYAQKWAESNHFAFKANDIWSTARLPDSTKLRGLLPLLLIVLLTDEKTFFWFSKKTGKYVRSMRPQDRPELYPINYRFP